MNGVPSFINCFSQLRRSKRQAERKALLEQICRGLEDDDLMEHLSSTSSFSSALTSNTSSIWDYFAKQLESFCAECLKGRTRPGGLSQFRDTIVALRLVSQRGRLGTEKGLSVFDLCIKVANDASLLEEAGQEIIEIMKNITLQVKLRQSDVHALWTIAKNQLDQIYQNAQYTSRNATASYVAEAFESALHSKGFLVENKMFAEVMHKAGEWLDPRDRVGAFLSPNIAEADRVVWQILIGLVKAFDILAVPLLTQHENLLKAYVSHIAASKLPKQSIVLQNIALFSQTYLRVFADYAAQWAGGPDWFFSSRQLSLSILFRDILGGYQISEIGTAFDWCLLTEESHSRTKTPQLDRCFNQGYYNYLALAADIVHFQWLIGPPKETPVLTLDDILVRIEQGRDAVPWLQLAYVLFREHPHRGPHMVQGTHYLSRVLFALLRQLQACWEQQLLDNNKSSSSSLSSSVRRVDPIRSAAAWVLRCFRVLCFSCNYVLLMHHQDQSKSWSSSTTAKSKARHVQQMCAIWGNIWVLLATKILPNLGINHPVSHICFQLANAILNTRLVDPQDVQSSFPALWKAEIFPQPPSAMLPDGSTLTAALFTTDSFPPLPRPPTARSAAGLSSTPSKRKRKSDIAFSSDVDLSPEHNDTRTPQLTVEFLIYALRHAHLYEIDFAQSSARNSSNTLASSHGVPLIAGTLDVSTVDSNGILSSSPQKHREKLQSDALSPFVPRSSVAAHSANPKITKRLFDSPKSRKRRKEDLDLGLFSQESNASSSASSFLQGADEGCPPSTRRETILRWALKWLFHVSSAQQQVSTEFLHSLSTLLVALVRPGDVRDLSTFSLPAIEVLFDTASAQISERYGTGLTPLFTTDPDKEKAHQCCLENFFDSNRAETDINRIPSAFLPALQNVTETAIRKILKFLESEYSISDAKTVSPDHLVCASRFAYVVGVIAHSACSSKSSQTTNHKNKYVEFATRVHQHMSRAFPTCILGYKGQTQFFQLVSTNPFLSALPKDNHIWNHFQAHRQAVIEAIQQWSTNRGVVVENHSPLPSDESRSAAAGQGSQGSSSSFTSSSSTLSEHQSKSKDEGETANKKQNTKEKKKKKKKKIRKDSFDLSSDSQSSEDDFDNEFANSSSSSKAGPFMSFNSKEIEVDSDESDVELFSSSTTILQENKALQRTLVPFDQAQFLLKHQLAVLISLECSKTQTVLHLSEFLSTATFGPFHVAVLEALTKVCVEVIADEAFSSTKPLQISVKKGVDAALLVAKHEDVGILPLHAAASFLYSVLDALAKKRLELKSTSFTESSWLMRLLATNNGFVVSEENEEYSCIPTKTPSNELIPTHTRLNVVKMITSVNLLMMVGAQDDVSPVKFILRCATHDKNHVVRALAAQSLCKFLPLFFLNEDQQYVFYCIRRINSFQHREATLSGTQRCMPCVDPDMGNDSYKETSAKSIKPWSDSSNPWTIMHAINEDFFVWTNWLVIFSFAAGSRAFLGTAIFRFCLFDRSSQDVKGVFRKSWSDHLCRCTAFRRSMLQTLVLRLSQMHHFRSLYDLFSGYSLYLCANWLRYLPKTLDLLKLLYSHATRKEEPSQQQLDQTTSTYNPFLTFPFRLFGFESPEMFFSLTKSVWMSALVVHGATAQEFDSFLTLYTSFHGEGDQSFSLNQKHEFFEEVSLGVEAICGPLMQAWPSSEYNLDTWRAWVQSKYRNYPHLMQKARSDPSMLIDLTCRALNSVSSVYKPSLHQFFIHTKAVRSWIGSELEFDKRNVFASQDGEFSGDSKNISGLLAVEAILHLSCKIDLNAPGHDSGATLEILDQVRQWWTGKLSPLTLDVLVHLLLRQMIASEAHILPCSYTLTKVAESLQTATHWYQSKELIFIVSFTACELLSKETDPKRVQALMKLAREWIRRPHRLAYMEALTELSKYVDSRVLQNAACTLPAEVISSVGARQQVPEEQYKADSVVTVLVGFYGNSEKSDALRLKSNPQLYTPVCLSVLHLLKGALQQSPEEVLQSKQLPDLIWALLSLTESHNPESVKHRAMRCLGQIGTLDTSVADLLRFQVDAQQRKEKQMRYASSPFADLLLHMVFAVSGSDNVLALCSLEAIKFFLSTDRGRNAAKALPTVAQEKICDLSVGDVKINRVPKSNLVEFRISSKLASLKYLLGDVSATPDNTSSSKGADNLFLVEKVWQACVGDEFSFQDWICAMSYSIAKFGVDSRHVLHSCCYLCLLDPSFASLCFPYLVNELVTARRISKTCSNTSSSQKQVTGRLTRARTHHSVKSDYESEDERGSSQEEVSSPLLISVGNQYCAILQENANADESAVRMLLMALSHIRRAHMKKALDRIAHNNRSSQVAKGTSSVGCCVEPILDPLLSQLDLLQIAKAALRCDMASTALLHVELYLYKNHPDGTFLENNPQGSESAEKILFEAYHALGTPDALHSVGTLRGLRDMVDVDLLKGDWDMALAGLDGLLQSAPSALGHPVENRESLESLMSVVLRREGLNHLYDHFQERPEDAQMMKDEKVLSGMCDSDFEAGWRYLRLVNQNHLSFHKLSSFNYILYQGLASLIDGDLSRFQQFCETGRSQVIQTLSTVLLSKESTAQIYNVLLKAQQLHELETIRVLRWQGVRPHSTVSRSVEKQVVNSWDDLMHFRHLDYDAAEPLLALRTSMLHAVKLSMLDCADGADGSSSGTSISAALNGHLMFLSRFARLAGRNRLARNFLHQVGHVYAVQGMEKTVEQAAVLWANGHYQSAVRLLKCLQTEQSSTLGSKSAKSQLVLADAYHKTALWLAESSVESSKTILDEYLSKSISLCESVGTEGSTQLAACQITKARYVDKLYNSVVSRMRSHEGKKLRAFQAERESQLGVLRTALDESTKHAKNQEGESRAKRARPQTSTQQIKDLQRLVIELEQQVARDKDSQMEEKATLDRLLITTVEAYLVALGNQREAPVSFIFRLVSIWFDNERHEHVNRMIREKIVSGALPTIKLLPLIYQIASRVGSEVDRSCGFGTAVHDVLAKTTKDHPFFVVPHLFALANGNWLPKRQRFSSFATLNSAKQKEAGEILDGIENDSSCTKETRDDIALMRLVLEALTHLAYVPIPKAMVRSGRTFNTSSMVPVFETKMSSYRSHDRCVPVPVAELIPRADMDYNSRRDEMALLNSFDRTFKTTEQGKNLPKIINAKTTKGEVIKMLVKGNDDMRQDAVMQQLFSLVHELLLRDRRTAKSRLDIRRYSVVPLTPVAGAIQWVENSMALATYLTFKDENLPSAHDRYRRAGDYLFLEAGRKLRAVQTEAAKMGEEKGAQRILEVFRDICAHFTPVMHHFFLEKFRSPVEWYTRRTAYTKSVAVNSVVGYIFGIGDRHMQNILIDKTSGELIHIDFGYVFEQSKLLPVPELVPFRLTRDIIDGMGVTGFNGTFLSSSEATMHVLRDNAESLLAICKVFVYDPLLKWTLSPVKAARLQQGSVLDADESSNSQQSLKSLSLSTGRSMLDDSSPGSSQVSSTTVVGAKKRRVTAENSLDSDPHENIEAESVLLRVQDKLFGREDRGGDAMTVPGQIRRLINEARDERLLSAMYHGWSPFA